MDKIAQMEHDKNSDIVRLTHLVAANSKHSNYQLLHPRLAPLIPESSYSPLGKFELQRQAYMEHYQPVTGLSVLDIGANTGYFSFAALAGGARKVVSLEGNKEHAEFISLGARCLGFDNRIKVHPHFFDFAPARSAEERYDLAFCLNVLHHLGEDFGTTTLSLETAKSGMIAALNRLSSHTKVCWMQLGFNWKGNCDFPLFANGTKSEIIEFIEVGTKDYWAIERVAVVDPSSRSYVDVTSKNLQRFDGMGEFLNRPLFFLHSKYF